MGLFDQIFRPRKAKESVKALKEAKGFFQTLTAYQPCFTTWNGCIYESLLVRAAIDARARHISKLRVEFIGSANPRLQAKMRLAPNQWQTYSQFLYRTSTILDCTNTAFITPVFDDSMTITGYIPVLPQYCSVIEYKDEPWLRYQFANGRVGAVEMRKVAMMTKFQYRNDFFGESNSALNETMNLIHIENQGIEEAIKNSSTFRFMARLTNFSKVADLKKERDDFVEANMASGHGGLLLFKNTYDDIKQINQASYTVDAAQREAIEENVNDYFGVNRDVLQNKAGSDALDAFFNGCVEPFSIQFSEAMTMACFSERERAQGSKVQATANRLQYMSNTQKVNMAKELGDRGALTIDEIRELFNYAPLPDGAGNMAPIRGEYYDANEGKENAE